MEDLHSAKILAVNISRTYDALCAGTEDRKDL